MMTRNKIETFEQLQEAIREASQRSQELRAELSAGVEALRSRTVPLKNIIYWAGIIFGLWRRFSRKK